MGFGIGRSDRGKAQAAEIAAHKGIHCRAAVNEAGGIAVSHCTAAALADQTAGSGSRSRAGRIAVFQIQIRRSRSVTDQTAGNSSTDHVKPTILLIGHRIVIIPIFSFISMAAGIAAVNLWGRTGNDAHQAAGTATGLHIDSSCTLVDLAAAHAAHQAAGIAGAGLDVIGAVISHAGIAVMHQHAGDVRIGYAGCQCASVAGRGIQAEIHKPQIGNAARFGCADARYRAEQAHCGGAVFNGDPRDAVAFAVISQLVVQVDGAIIPSLAVGCAAGSIKNRDHLRRAHFYPGLEAIPGQVPGLVGGRGGSIQLGDGLIQVQKMTHIGNLHRVAAAGCKEAVGGLRCTLGDAGQRLVGIGNGLDRNIVAGFDSCRGKVVDFIGRRGAEMHRRIRYIVQYDGIDVVIIV